MTGPLPPAGWYPDRDGQRRWWDGTGWTQHAAAAAATLTSGAPGAGPSRLRRLGSIVATVYAGTPRQRTPLRVAQGLCAGVLTLAALGAVLPPTDPPTSPAGHDTPRRPATSPTLTPAPDLPTPPPPSPAQPVAGRAALPDGEDGAVTGHVDGDTLRVDGRKVRLIGIDAPETRHPRLGAQCYGQQASARLASLLPLATRVRLVYDADHLDRYGRTLAYLYRVPDALFVNAELVRGGHATILTVPPNVARTGLLIDLQREARDARRGLWSACPEPPPETTVDGPPAGGPTADCDPSYPDVCIPPPPPDLDCADIPYRRFRVVGADPHRFDADHDGIGCES